MITGSVLAELTGRSGWAHPGERLRAAVASEPAGPGPNPEERAMLRRMTDMPDGTIGFEAVGEVEDDDWEAAVEPVLRREIAAGGKVRLLYLHGPQAREVEGDAVHADIGFRARHAGAFERVAVVTDESWMRPALSVLSFLMPGKARAFAVHDLPAAKAWLVDEAEPAS
jgi:stage II sporulation SpoAA-like protein